MPKKQYPQSTILILHTLPFYKYLCVFYEVIKFIIQVIPFINQILYLTNLLHSFSCYTKYGTIDFFSHSLYNLKLK